MRVKNVSSTEIILTKFDLALIPGEIGDLSSFDPKVLHTDKTLDAYFKKGLLVNLGNLSPSGSKEALLSARNRINKLKLGDYVVKQSPKAPSQNRKKINDLLKKTAPRQRQKGEFNSDVERYGDEYYENMYPARESEEHSEPKPRPKFENKFRNMEISPEGTISEFGAYGTIETEILTGKTTELNTQVLPSTIRQEEKIIVKDKGGNEYKVSLENIRERAKRKCIGTTSTGKPCKKWSIVGFQSCLTHFSRTEKREYEALKNSPKTSPK